VGLVVAVQRRAVGPDLAGDGAAGVGQLEIEKVVAVAILAPLLAGQEGEALDRVAVSQAR
jgi:hypothetical protein